MSTIPYALHSIRVLADHSEARRELILALARSGAGERVVFAFQELLASEKLTVYKSKTTGQVVLHFDFEDDGAYFTVEPEGFRQILSV